MTDGAIEEARGTRAVVRFELGALHPRAGLRAFAAGRFPGQC